MKKMHDSGKRQQFIGGAQRDSAEGKPQLHLLSPHLYNFIAMNDSLVGRPMTEDDEQHIISHTANTVRGFVVSGNPWVLYTALVDMLDAYGIERLVEWLRLGAEKYSAFNWAKGMPFTRVLDSLLRHLAKWDQKDEDHPAAIMCNIMFLLHYLVEIEAGRLSSEWNDLFVFDRVKGKIQDGSRKKA